jgi:TRAP-type C4-dicarboxylate transport system permease small subunit
MASLDISSPVLKGIHRYIYRPSHRVVEAIETILLIFCSGAILVAMGLTTLDVILRYGFSSPLGWSFDFIMLYLMPAAYYLSFSYGMKTGAHLSVDFFAEQFPRSFLRIVVPVFMIAGAILMAYIAGRIGEEAVASYEAGETIFGSVAWPTWPTSAIIGVSFLLLSIRMLLVAFRAAFLEG